MPIRPSEKKRYPKDWKAIVLEIRARSAGRCECMGECGIDHSGRSGGRCLELNGLPAINFRGLVVLTVAHRNHRPEDCRRTNLFDACQRCHNRYDQPHRQANARRTRETKRERYEPRLQLMPLLIPGKNLGEV